MTVLVESTVKPKLFRVVVRRILWTIATLVLSFIALEVAFLTTLRYLPPDPVARSAYLKPMERPTATVRPGEIAITWNNVAGAISYQVLRSEKADRDYVIAGTPYGLPKWAPVRIRPPQTKQVTIIMDRYAGAAVPGAHFGRLPSPPFVDTEVEPNHTYYYRVRATDGSGWTDLSPIVAATAVASSAKQEVSFYADASKDVGPLDHKWEVSLGSERLSYMLDGDPGSLIPDAAAGLRRANKLAHDELGIQQIISHGILDDAMGVYSESADGQPIYSWTKLDQAYDALLADGLKPFVQLDFMPKLLSKSSHPSKVHSYDEYTSPPKDNVKWRNLISALALHLIDRYGRPEVESWRFEVWNEPDVCMWWWNICYWDSGPEAYFQFYEETAKSLKSVDPKLRVGGPSVMFTKFIEPFLQYLTAHNDAALFDFLDVHLYGGPVADWHPLLQRYGFGDRPVYYGEWGLSELWGDKLNDMPYGAAWIPHSLYISLDKVDGVSYWTASDYFGESKPKTFFHGGFGLIGLDGIRKPRFWAYYLLHRLGNRRLQMVKQSPDSDLISGWATKHADGDISVILSNLTEDRTHADGDSRLTKHIRFTLTGLPPNRRLTLFHYRIDETHSNVMQRWAALGKPSWPDAEALADLHRHDSLDMLEQPKSVVVDSDGRVTTEFDMPMPSVSALDFNLSRAEHANSRDQAKF